MSDTKPRYTAKGSMILDECGEAFYAQTRTTRSSDQWAKLSCDALNRADTLEARVSQLEQLRDGNAGAMEAMALTIGEQDEKISALTRERDAAIRERDLLQHAVNAHSKNLLEHSDCVNEQADEIERLRTGLRKIENSLSALIEEWAGGRLDWEHGACNPLIKIRDAIRVALEAAGTQSLLREPNAKPTGCHCKPGRCMAPVVMGHQTPCLDPAKAVADMVCVLCGGPAEYRADEGVWRHRGHPAHEVNQIICDKYGYPIDVTERPDSPASQDSGGVVNKESTCKGTGAERPQTETQPQ